MPEYVYALHDFLPENEDEISFHAGDRIEVIERDDEFGDGWWQGKNLDGNTGLFPQSYTAPAPPISSSNDAPLTKSALVPLDEESETESTPKTPQNEDDHPMGVLSSPPSHHRLNSSDGEIMKATMTDVQQAIEQLGRGQATTEDGDGARSFSFASSKDDAETDTEYENISDFDGPDTGEGWHHNARKRLAEKARRAVEEAEKLEAMSSGYRSTAPPIDVELSDESDAEDNLDHGDFSHPTDTYNRRSHPYIPEEDEDVSEELAASSGIPTATNATFPAPLGEKKDEHFSADTSEIHLEPVVATIFGAITSSNTTAAATPASSTLGDLEERTQGTASDRDRESHKRSSVQSVPKTSGTPDFIKAPEPKRSSLPRSVGGIAVLNSLDGVVRAVSPPAAQVQSQAPRSPTFSQTQTLQDYQEPRSTWVSLNAQSVQEMETQKQPNEWTVAEVVEWLKTKGFDQDVQIKFIEQEITGDVLLELDANLLKSEIGIMAFGKRVRIANAITELRQPQSISGSPHFQSAPPQAGYTQHSPELFSAGSFHPQQYSSSSPPQHTHSVIHSTHSSLSPLNGQSSTASAGPGQGMLFTQSMPAGLQPALSLPSPVTAQGPGWGGPPPIHENGVNGDGEASVSGSKAGSLQDTTTGSFISKEEKVGLGLLVQDDNEKSTLKSRPAQLSLSPSIGALSDTVKALNGDDDDEDRGHMSETDKAKKKARRKLFGLSQDSSLSRDSASRHSISSAQSSPKKNTADKDKDSTKSSTRTKKGSDGGRTGTERLSIFGATFTGSFGKSRKPAPKYATDDSERSSLLPISRFSASMGRKASGTPNGSPKFAKDEDKGKEKEGTHVLRKRTNSYPGHVAALNDKQNEEDFDFVATKNGDSLPLKQGVSILQQIGEPNHAGWMRKKGDKYGSWKVRYFVLSGHHLYWLKSNNRMETKIKGYINVVGYKVTVDETVDPGKYGFRIDHDTDKTHYFSSETQTVIRDWMKAIMKATIGRDYSHPVISSCNIPTIPLTVAQAMNPAPRPPSPSARAATQRAHRSKDLETLGMKDLNEVPEHAALVLMGLQPRSEERAKLDSVFPEALGKGKNVDEDASSTPRAGPSSSSVPPRPMREAKRTSLRGISTHLDNAMLEWANSHLPFKLHVTNPSEQTYSALALFRIAESIKGKPMSPPLPDSSFPTGPNDDKAMEGLFALFDFLVNNEVKMGSVSINEVRLQRPDKIAQIVKALKSWEDRKRILSQAATVQAGTLMAQHLPVSWA
ncbi:hypothetical protein JOM56_004334 [Amanita muscaria]